MQLFSRTYCRNFEQCAPKAILGTRVQFVKDYRPSGSFIGRGVRCSFFFFFVGVFSENGCFWVVNGEVHDAAHCLRVATANDTTVVGLVDLSTIDCVNLFESFVFTTIIFFGFWFSLGFLPPPKGECLWVVNVEAHHAAHYWR